MVVILSAKYTCSFVPKHTCTLSAKHICTSLHASWFCLFVCNFDAFCFARSYQISTSLKRRYKTQALCVGRHQGVADLKSWPIDLTPSCRQTIKSTLRTSDLLPSGLWLHDTFIFISMAYLSTLKIVDETRSQYFVNTSSQLHHPPQLSLRLPDYTPCSLHHPHTTPTHGRLIIIHWHNFNIRLDAFFKLVI